MFSFSVQTRDFLSSMATTLQLLEEAVPIISAAERSFKAALPARSGLQLPDVFHTMAQTRPAACLGREWG